MSALAASEIVSMLDRVAVRSSAERCGEAERLLCGLAPGLSLDGVRKAVAQALAWMGLDDLRAGTGLAQLEGITAPASAASARKLAASARIIPCVLGGEGEILDWGQARRLFTRAQKLAPVERDGGCAMCNLPPGMTKAHHLRWWARDAGPTDLDNGVLLCESCHHRIHDNDWADAPDSTTSTPAPHDPGHRDRPPLTGATRGRCTRALRRQRHAATAPACLVRMTHGAAAPVRSIRPGPLATVLVRTVRPRHRLAPLGLRGAPRMDLKDLSASAPQEADLRARAE